VINGLIVLVIENEKDRNFMADLYENYYSLIKNIIRKYVQDNSNIEDLIHNVIINLIDKIPLLISFEKYVLISYISAVSKNIAVNFIKHQNINSEFTFFGDEEDIADSIEDRAKMPEEFLINKEENENLNKILKKLPEKQRLFLQFKYFFEMNDKEIAKIFGIKPESVKVYISRAREKAYKLFTESGIKYEPK
jgi:RNA polymerase sigma-70 factor (ECF subfamily)